ncbi:hypothetical protein [Staphylococcus aureus]
MPTTFGGEPYKWTFLYLMS